MIITTITFISQRWLFPSKTGEAYFNLGLNCFPLIIAAFFSLKQLRDKKLYYDLEKDYYQATEQDFPHTIKNNDTSYSQGGKPHGRIGTFIGKLMNRFHTPYYRKYFKSITLNKNARILDIGCGGGSFLHYLNKRDSSFQLHGLDHSEEMISLASKKNRIAINKKQLELHIGSVSKLNLDNNSLDMITAFETIQFWPDHELAFHEIYRTLDNNGEFLVINRYPKEGTKWWDYAKLKTDKEYESALLKAHFQNVSTDLRSRKGWIIVRATKNDPLKTPEI